VAFDSICNDLCYAKYQELSVLVFFVDEAASYRMRWFQASTPHQVDDSESVFEKQYFFA